MEVVKFYQGGGEFINRIREGSMGLELQSTTENKTCRLPFDKILCSPMPLSTSTILSTEASKSVKAQVLKHRSSQPNGKNLLLVRDFFFKSHFKFRNTKGQ